MHRSEIYPKIAADKGNQVNLVGSWRTLVGDLDTYSEFHFRSRIDFYGYS